MRRKSKSGLMIGLTMTMKHGEMMMSNHKLTTHRGPKRIDGPLMYWPIVYGQNLSNDPSYDEERPWVRAALTVAILAMGVGLLVMVMAW
jgi:hypothetical protein